MESSNNYPDLLEKGLRKKKKKMERGETGYYDPSKAKKAEDKAGAEVLRGRMKKLKMKGY